MAVHRLSRRPVYGCRGMICSNSPLAASAGLRSSRKVAMPLMPPWPSPQWKRSPLCRRAAWVVMPSSCSMKRQTGKITGVNSSGVAASGATSEYYRTQGYRTMPLDGPHAVSVPGEVAAWEVIHQQFCTKPFAQLLDSAIGYAENGFPLPPGIGRSLCQ